jgi:hypothetical protein
VAVRAAVAAGAAGDPPPDTTDPIAEASMKPVTSFRAAALAVAVLVSLPLFPATAQAADAKATGPAMALPAQRSFASADDAAKALVEAMRGDDLKAVYAVLGPGSGALIFSGDKVADDALRARFVAAYDKSMRVDPEGDARATLLIGVNDYPFPYPLVRHAKGWSFDARSGAEEIVNRRIGENELAAIQVCLAYVDAQREYALADASGKGLPQYAQKILSTPGKRDGLYWETKDGEAPSPLGPIVLRAKGEGYGEGGGYHGYRYKVLTAQGKDASGGAYDYIVNGRMIGGFALVSWPLRWGVSGVMTFICNHDGVVYEKNLGPDTATIAAKMTRYNPDSTWTRAEH